MENLRLIAKTTLLALLLAFAGCGKAAEKTGEGGPKKDDAAAKPAAPKVEPVQAEGVWQLFLSVKDDKLEDFKKAWSKKRSEAMEKNGWEESFKEWGREIKDEIGEGYELSDFKFEFKPKEGKEGEGWVLGTLKEKKLPKLDVILEEGLWKVNER